MKGQGTDPPIPEAHDSVSKTTLGVWWEGKQVCLRARRAGGTGEVVRCKTYHDLLLALRVKPSIMPSNSAFAAAAFALAIFADEHAEPEAHLLGSQRSFDWEGLIELLRQAKAELDATRPDDLELAAATRHIVEFAEAYGNDNHFPYLQYVDRRDIADVVRGRADAMVACTHSTATLLPAISLETGRPTLPSELPEPASASLESMPRAPVLSMSSLGDGSLLSSLEDPWPHGPALLAAAVWVLALGWWNTSTWTQLEASAGKVGVTGWFTIDECKEVNDGEAGVSRECAGRFKGLDWLAPSDRTILVNPTDTSRPKGARIAARLVDRAVYEESRDALRLALYRAIFALLLICAVPVYCVSSAIDPQGDDRLLFVCAMWVAALFTVIGFIVIASSLG